MAARGSDFPTLSHRQALSLGLLVIFLSSLGRWRSGPLLILNRSVCVLLLGCRSSSYVGGLQLASLRSALV